MEVGAVKQAFNNEVILLKKKLNQAKIQTIHKLTRKAKTLTEKKVPEKLKEKFTKKAKSAVQEVLIIKKLKARDVARFIVTHKGELNVYLNKPTVDTDKACARLLLHKALQDKYKIIRERFSNISIQDLLMSRQERRKLKKEAREKQKNKTKTKDSDVPIEAKGDWNIEDVDLEGSQLNSSDNDEESSADENDKEQDREDDFDESENNVALKASLLLKDNISNNNVNSSNVESSESNDEIESDNETEQSNNLQKFDHDLNESDNSVEDDSVGKFVKLASNLSNDPIVVNNKNAIEGDIKLKQNDNNKKIQGEKKHKDNKNKNLKNKILFKKFNKDISEIPQEQKVADPFFITATGENYMSVAESRPPDEVKEEHRQGNRKYRRAVMFGHVPKKKFREGFQSDGNNSRFSKHDDNRGSYNSNLKSNSFDKHGTQKRFDNAIESNFNGSSRLDKKNDNVESKPEKLHPSWEAKKRQSGLLPFQGKKIVFDES